MDTRPHTVAFSLIDPAVHADPHRCEVWPSLRAAHPVSWCEFSPQGEGFWLLSRYSDIVTAYRDPARFSSQRGNVLATLLSGGDSAGGRMLVVTDPPRHGEFRRILQSAFSPRALDQVADSIRTATRHLVAMLVETGKGDFAVDVAAQIPLLAMCELFEIPPAERSTMLELSMRSMGTDGSVVPESEAAAAQRELLGYYAGLLARRREAPGTDLVSLMATRRVDGKPLSDGEILLNCYNVLIGGDETTRFSAAGAALALIEHPEQWQRLKDEDSLALDSAVEEILRWTTPATHVARTATTDVVLHGRRIRAGDIVTLWNVSANRDESVFPRPYRFDLARGPNRHVALGRGPHFCLGAPLARLELRLLLHELRTQVPGLELDGPVERIRSSVLSGISRLPVAVRR